MVSTKTLVASIIAIIVVVIVVISVPIGVGLAKMESTTKPPATLPVTPVTPVTEKPFDANSLKGDEATRIDCFLEAQSRFENLTKYACEKRNCIYDPDVTHPKVPKCYFDRENLGYKLSQDYKNNSYLLKQSGKVPFQGAIDLIQLNVEYYNDNMIRVKVSQIIQFECLLVSI